MAECVRENEEGVYGFRPWIGEYYQQNMWGRRVLVLGESHYQWDENQPIDNWPTLTIECVKETIAGEYTGRFWTNIAVAFLNPPSHHLPSLAEKGEFWRTVAFYNYIQQGVGFGPYPNPTPRMWTESLPAFQSLLNTLQPELVIVLGRQNWWNVQGLGGQEGPHIEGARHAETQWLPHAGGWCLAYGICHPSARGRYGFNGRYWHPFIMQALQYADGPH